MLYSTSQQRGYWIGSLRYQWNYSKCITELWFWIYRAQRNSTSQHTRGLIRYVNQIQLLETYCDRKGLTLITSVPFWHLLTIHITIKAADQEVRTTKILSKDGRGIKKRWTCLETLLECFKVFLRSLVCPSYSDPISKSMNFELSKTNNNKEQTNW